MHLQVPEKDQQVTRETFQFRVDKKKLQEAEWHDGHYLLRSNLTAGDPSVLWARYVQLTQIESVFRSLKSELGIRPIYHQLEHRADAHILIAFLAYCLQITLKQRLLLHAPGLTPTAVLEKLAAPADDRTRGLRLTFINAVFSASNLTESFPKELWPLLWQDRMLSVALRRELANQVPVIPCQDDALSECAAVCSSESPATLERHQKQSCR